MPQRLRVLLVLAMVSAATMAAAQTRGAAKAPVKKTSTQMTCAEDLGFGVASKRHFCDVVVASVAAGQRVRPDSATHRDRHPDVRFAQPLHRPGRAARAVAGLHAPHRGGRHHSPDW
jgi:hypothetical protein